MIGINSHFKTKNMKKHQLDKIMNILIGLSAAFILIGALLKLGHYQNGNLLLWIGFMSNFVFTGLEINRLKRVIKILKEHRVE